MSPNGNVIAVSTVIVGGSSHHSSMALAGLFMLPGVG
jgi:hypothetical protein